MRKHVIATLLALFFITLAFAQNVIVEGYTFETDNRGYLREVKITVYSANNAIKAETHTNEDGFFTFEVSPGEDYKIKATKSIFEDTFYELKADEMIGGKKVYAKMEIARKPGYLFDVTLSDSYYDMEGAKNGIDSAKIEIYNNTTGEEVLVLDKHPFPNFTYTFEQGNFYTVMIRKEGYFTKRMEAHVNIDGCILCFEGMGQVRPSDNLTEGNTMGSLIANVEMDKIRLSQGIKVENIYYDYNSWTIRQDAAVELDKIVLMMKDNPGLIIELGSHTDARGQEQYNLELSEKRAKSAVAYIMRQGNIPAEKIKARGYGESQIVNRCKDNIECSDKEHEQNRRTMIKVVGFAEDDPYQNLSLREIIYNENLEKASFEDFESFEYVEGGELPDEIKKDLERQQKREAERAKALANGDLQPSVPVTPQPKAAPKTTTPVQPETIVEKVKETKPQIKKEIEKTVVEETTDVVITPKKKIRSPSTNKKDKNEDILTSKTGAFGEKVTKPEEKLPLQKASVVPFLGAKKIEDGFTGFMIEFFNSNVELSSEHSIFRQYGQIRMEQKDSGEYAYMIGGFTTEKEANDYMDKILKDRFPASEVVLYVQGHRVVSEE